MFKTWAPIEVSAENKKKGSSRELPFFLLITAKKKNPLLIPPNSIFENVYFLF